MVKNMPGFSAHAVAAGLAVMDDVGQRSEKCWPRPWPQKSRTTEHFARLRHRLLDGMADIAGGGAGLHHPPMPRIMRFIGDFQSAFRAFRLISPTGYMRLVSPCQPSTITVTSILTMSPSRSSLSPGMPWQTT